MAEITERLRLIEAVQPDTHELLTTMLAGTVEQRQAIQTKISELFKLNEIDDIDKFCLLTFYYFKTSESDPYDIKSDVLEAAEFILTHWELPRIRVKLAILEVLYAFLDDSQSVELVKTSDLYARSDAFLNRFAQLRDIKFFLKDEDGKNADKNLREMLSALDIDKRKFKPSSHSFQILKIYKDFIETGLGLLLQKSISFEQFENSLKGQFDLSCSDITKTRIVNGSRSKVDMALEIMTDSKLIDDPRTFWDLTKSKGSSKLSHWIEIFYAYKFPSLSLCDPVLRSAKVWKPLERVPIVPSYWTQSAENASIGKFNRAGVFTGSCKNLMTNNKEL